MAANEIPSTPPFGASSSAGSAPGETSRDLLMTVLGELVLPNSPTVWTQTLIEALGLLGVQDKAARQAISRMHDRGWLLRTRVGRRTRWALSESAGTLLRDGGQHIYDFGRSVRSWDRRWLLLLASVPERDRNLRYRMGVALRWAGFGSLGNGTWVSPWVEQEDDVVELMGSLGVDATLFVARLGQLGDPVSLARRAWDLPALSSSYDAFLADTQNWRDREPSDEDAVRELVALVHSWRRFPSVDPDVPRELLSHDWPGPEAAHRFAEMRRALLAPATSWWTRTEARYEAAS